MHRNEKSSNSGQSRKQSSKMPGDCVVFSFSILMGKNSSVSWQKLVESLKFRCQQQCFVEFNFMSTGKPVAHSDSTGRNMPVSLRPTNPWGYAWKVSKQEPWRPHLRKRCEFIESLQSSAQCLQQSKFQMQRQQWKMRKNSIKYWHGSWRKSETKMKWSLASLMDLSHLKNSEPQFQKDKGRVVLRGDIVKDDSGSYAVFTEQGSSASQMKAAKVMDVTSRPPGCAGQTADAISA